MHFVAKEALRLLGRMGTRAVAQAVDSVLSDADDLASGATKRIRKARKRIKDIPRENIDPEDE